MGSKEFVVEPSTPNHECCMCGDYGLPYELFRCRVCLSRSQHRYYSNLYPKIQSYRVCNWCLNKEGTTQNFSLSSTCSNINKYNNINSKGEEDKKSKIKNKISSSKSCNRHVVLKVLNPMKKKRCPDRLSACQKKIITLGGGEEESAPPPKKMKPEKITNMGRRKQVYRGKAPRYKLLEEVCSQSSTY